MSCFFSIVFDLIFHDIHIEIGFDLQISTNLVKSPTLNRVRINGITRFDIAEDPSNSPHLPEDPSDHTRAGQTLGNRLETSTTHNTVNEEYGPC